jgi:adenylate cyclase
VIGRDAVARLRHVFLPEQGVVRALPYAIVAAIGLAGGLLVGSLSLAQRLEWALYDRMMTAAARDPQPPSDIVVVAIDEPSFSELRTQWPWPRRVHAALIDALVKDGARTIAFDVTFAEPSTPQDDDALASAVRKGGNVVLSADRALTTDRGYQIEQWVEPLPALAAAAAGIGAVSVEPDPDSVVRRAPAIIDDRPTLALAVASRQPGFTAPVDPGRDRLIHFLGAPRRGVLTVSYYQAIEPGLLPAGMFRDKIVVVGRSLSAAAALDAPDHFRTPVAVLMPGVEIQANQIDTLLRHRAIADPFGGFRASLLWAAAFGVAGAFAFFRLAPQHGLMVLVAAAIAAAGAGYISLADYGVRVPVVGPLVAAIGVYTSTAAYRYALGQRERRLIKRAFQHFVAPTIVQQMLDDPSRLKLGGDNYDVTVIFTDLEGFTTISEHLTPEALRARLSVYFKAMMDVLLAERATLDKFIGDAIMVYFGCPIPDGAHPQQACRAALAMQRRLDALNDEWQRAGAPKLRMRVGINTGIAVAGNMGTDQIFNYTILGDCVNLASRLEGVNKTYHTLTIVGEDTWTRVQGQFEGRELDWIRVKGKTDPVAIYELLAEAGRLPDQAVRVRDRFAEGLALYRAQKWDAATSAFGAALAIDADDGPSLVFLDRCAQNAAAPPPPGWDGVHVMTTK